MRFKIDAQQRLDFRTTRLPVTEEYYQRYEAISNLLDDNPGILDAVHRDLSVPANRTGSRPDGATSYKFTTENVLRSLLVLTLEGVSLRRGVVLIDDSEFLRRFVRIYDGPMMDYSTLDKLKNAIQPKTWHEVNQHLSSYAVSENGDRYPPSLAKLIIYELPSTPFSYAFCRSLVQPHPRRRAGSTQSQ